LICGVCKQQIDNEKRKEHLTKYHKLDGQLIEWMIDTDDDLKLLNQKDEFTATL
jgi:hypothetical protein